MLGWLLACSPGWAHWEDERRELLSAWWTEGGEGLSGPALVLSAYQLPCDLSDEGLEAEWQIAQRQSALLAEGAWILHAQFPSASGSWELSSAQVWGGVWEQLESSAAAQPGWDDQPEDSRWTALEEGRLTLRLGGEELQGELEGEEPVLHARFTALLCQEPSLWSQTWIQGA